MINTNYRCFLGALLLLGASASASAQQVPLPAFDSFSYYRDPLFGTQRQARVPAPQPQACPEPAPAIPAPPAECPKPDSSEIEPLAQNERYELQLALDKALSQILKLTVDYEALQTRVQNMAQAGQADSDGWFSLGGQGRGEEDEVQALIDLNAKRLADRDEQVALLTRRLDALQTRYDNENVARLLAEKRLKVSKDKQNKMRRQSAAAGKKVKQLTQQLEQNQKQIRELKIAVTAEKLSTANGESTSATKPQPAAISKFVPAREWVISGLQFEEGSADIDRDSVDSLAPLLVYLRENAALAVQINGYTDNVGSAASNLSLSQERANAVAEYLVEQGIGSERIKALGYGERRPIASNESEQGREQNRRVAVLLLD